MKKKKKREKREDDDEDEAARMSRSVGRLAQVVNAIKQGSLYIISFVTVLFIWVTPTRCDLNVTTTQQSKQNLPNSTKLVDVLEGIKPTVFKRPPHPSTLFFFSSPHPCSSQSSTARLPPSIRGCGVQELENERLG